MTDLMLKAPAVNQLRNYPCVIHWQDREWLVSPEFYAENVEQYPELETAELDEVWAEMYRLQAEIEAGVEWSPKVSFGEWLEKTRQWSSVRRFLYAKMEACAKHICLRNNIAFLRGRDIADFGFLYYDQCSGVREKLACGCELDYVHDRYLVCTVGSDVPPTRFYNGITKHVVHKHCAHVLCARHEHLASADFATLHAEVHGDAIAVPVESLVGEADPLLAGLP